MKKVNTYHSKQSALQYGVWRDLAMLIKMRLTTMVVFTSVAAFLLASSFQFHWVQILVLIVGAYLVTGAANALNQVLEKDYDRLMERTADRPVAAGRMSASHAVLLAGFMSLFGTTLLGLFNPLTALLGMFSLICYAFVYTPMKRHSSVAVMIGAIPGALPMLIGCVAFDGYISILALSLFMIQFLWQFPHFWSIAYLGLNDYQKAEFRFLPLDEKNELSNRVYVESIVGSLLLIAIPYVLGAYYDMSIWSQLAMSFMALVFFVAAISFYKKRNRETALRLMLSSLVYLPVILLIMLIDKF